MVRMLIIDTMMKNKLTQFCYNDYIEFYKVKIIGINADVTDINYEFVDFIRNLNNYRKILVCILINLLMDRKQSTIVKIISLFFSIYISYY